jgi:acetyltransferase
MAPKPRGGYELIMGVTTDNVFGPVILFGQGGTAVEVVKDIAIALPPLNMKLALDLMSRTRIHRLLSGYRDIPAAAIETIQLTLVKLSQLIIDHPEIVELDINPLLADKKGVLALDARIRIEATNRRGADRLAIRPYPQELEEIITIANGQQILLRPIKPEDEPAHRKMLEHTAPRDIYFRFMRAVSYFPHMQLARFTQIDYDREMAFIATMTRDGTPETLAVIRAVTDANNEEAEFAIVVRTDMQGHGIGSRLMDKTIRYCRDRGTSRLVGQTLPENQEMIRLSKKFNFDTRVSMENQVVQLQLELQKN